MKSIRPSRARLAKAEDQVYARGDMAARIVLEELILLRGMTLMFAAGLEARPEPEAIRLGKALTDIVEDRP